MSKPARPPKPPHLSGLMQARRSLPSIEGRPPPPLPPRSTSISNPQTRTPPSEPRELAIEFMARSCSDSSAIGHSESLSSKASSTLAPPSRPIALSPTNTHTRTWIVDSTRLRQQEPARILKHPKPGAAIAMTTEFCLVHTASKLITYALPGFELLASAPLRYTAVAIYRNQVWAGTRDGSIHVLDVRYLSRNALMLKCHLKPVSRIWVAEDAILTVSEDDGKLNVWLPSQINTLRPLRTLRIVAGKHLHSVFSGSLLWLTRGRQVYVYDPLLLSGMLKPVPGFTLATDRSGNVGEVCSAAIGLGGGALFGHNDGTLTVIEQGNVVATVRLGIHGISHLVKIPVSSSATLSPRVGYWWVAMRPNRFMIIEINAADATVRQLLEWSGKIPEYLIATPDILASSSEMWSAHLNDQPLVQKHSPVNVQILSWNVAASSPDGVPPHIFQRPVEVASEKCDILVVGLQEVVELEISTQNAHKLVNVGDRPEHSTWRNYLKLIYEPLGLRLVATQGLVGLFMCIFVHHSLPLDSKPRTSIIKTGWGGRYGNKGATSAAVELSAGLRLAFVNVHLAAGHLSVVERNRDADEILRSKTELKPLDADYCFFFGDTNYRISVARERADGLIRNQDWASLWKYDQLKSQMTRNPAMALAMFREAPINFPPTYKFDTGTENYDTSLKERIPAWCDRILWRSHNGTVTTKTYTSLATWTSDHRPVFAAFALSN